MYIHMTLPGVDELKPGKTQAIPILYSWSVFSWAFTVKETIEVTIEVAGAIFPLMA